MFCLFRKKAKNMEEANSAVADGREMCYYKTTISDTEREEHR